MSGGAQNILLTGATGYVGGRLLPVLQARGHRVRCFVRDPAKLSAETEFVRGDIHDASALDRALEGMDAAYYMIHSMAGGEDFRERDRRAATTFAQAARRAGVRRVIYLGGLGRGADLSDHLESRQEVGRILVEEGVPTVELRAGIIIGRGSLSFEMVRALVERLPVMVTPRWVRTETQPIGIDDVIAYLVEALDVPAEGVYEIGGPERTSYLGLIREYARQRGYRRLVIPVPVLTPRLSSLWLGLVTPVQAAVGRKLLDGVRNETVVVDDRARRGFAVRPVGVRDAIARALAEGPPPESAVPRLTDVREAFIESPPERAFRPILRIGGDAGWYWGNFLWWLRGALDRLIGGVGLRRGRRDPESIAVDDRIDFWRVEAFEPGRLLRLAAEMKVPGDAWLQFEVEAAGQGRSVVRQTAIFLPRGLLGRLYWYALSPLHNLVFAGMLRGIVARVEHA